MKRSWVSALAVLAFLAAPALHAEEAFTTGKDWAKRMTVREKYISLLPPTMTLEDYDVHLRLGLPQYITLIDAILLRNPQLEGEDVSNIFVSTVYLVEPQNREKLKALEADFLAGNYEARPFTSPRLTLEDLTRETSA